VTNKEVHIYKVHKKQQRGITQTHKMMMNDFEIFLLA